MRASLTGHECEPSRCTQRKICVAVFEDRSALCNGVDVRRLDHVVAIRMESACAELVDHEDDNVGPACHGAHTRAANGVSQGDMARAKPAGAVIIFSS